MEETYKVEENTWTHNIELKQTVACKKKGHEDKDELYLGFVATREIGGEFVDSGSCWRR